MNEIKLVVKTWEEAQHILPMLCFDLGESPKIIHECFKEGHYLVYNVRKNYYVWKLNNVKESTKESF